jgi:hypothetical protein
MRATCIQPVSTLTCEKTKCQRLNQTEAKMQRENENKMCDAKQTDRCFNNQP